MVLSFSPSLRKKTVSRIILMWYKSQSRWSLGGKCILYQMILRYLYQNLINKRYVDKNNYPLTRLSFVSGLVIFCWHISHLLDFDTANIVSIYHLILYTFFSKRTSCCIWPINRENHRIISIVKIWWW